MFLLSFLPDFVFHLIFIIGVLAVVAGYFLDNVPFIGQNAKTIQVAGILLTVVGIWFEGGIANEEKWRARVLELEAKIARAEAASAEANAALAEQLARNQVLIKETTAANRQRIQQQAEQINKECKVNTTVINVLNDAARNQRGGAK